MSKTFCWTNDGVRRQDRLLNEAAGIELLQHGTYAFLSLVEEVAGDVGGYGIPISYAWDGESAIYVHCAPEGHKLQCMDAHPQVSLCVVGPTQVIPRKFTTNYSSLLIRGTIRRGLPPEERRQALALILRKYTPDDQVVGMKYAEKSFHRTEILRIDIASISGKAKQVQP